jgi:hypothetical protein
MVAAMRGAPNSSARGRDEYSVRRCELGGMGTSELGIALLGVVVTLIIPIVLVIWAVRTLDAIRRTQREILARLAALESRSGQQSGE